jgi:hypothetical protein
VILGYDNQKGKNAKLDEDKSEEHFFNPSLQGYIKRADNLFNC